MSERELPTAVLFDNDGLLLDTEIVWTRAESRLLERHGAKLTPELKMRMVGSPTHEVAALLAEVAGLDEPVEETTAALEALVVEELERGIEPMEGSLELLAEVRLLEIPVAVVSNTRPEIVNRALELGGVRGEFEVVVSGHEVAAPKPAPDAYLEACRRLGVEADRRAFALEDSPTGVNAGAAAGLTVIGVPSETGADLSAAHVIAPSLSAPVVREVLGLGLD